MLVATVHGSWSAATRLIVSLIDRVYKTLLWKFHWCDDSCCCISVFSVFLITVGWFVWIVFLLAVAHHSRKVCRLLQNFVRAFFSHVIEWIGMHRHLSVRVFKIEGTDVNIEKWTANYLPCNEKLIMERWKINMQPSPSVADSGLSFEGFEP